jgi:hypothetical protein
VWQPFRVEPLGGERLAAVLIGAASHQQRGGDVDLVRGRWRRLAASVDAATLALGYTFRRPLLDSGSC